jgi:hypothetical protein
MTPPHRVDWQKEMLRRLEIGPTMAAMQRYLYFARRCTAIEESSPAPNDHRIRVTIDERVWTECGITADEAMGRVILALPELTETDA